ncbi:regulatory protein RecX [Candidatus Peregrinibacteria bacterium]|nr:regulatory protein RecX [Candidatus Peregrinibacteria bacterium]
MDFDSLFHRAVRIVSVRMHSSVELKTKLKKNGAEEEVLTKVIEELKRLGLLNDDLYAETYIRGLIQKPVGLQKILFQCHRHGIPVTVTKKALQDMAWDEIESLAKAYQEKLRTIRETDVSKRFSKLASFLAGRGFSTALIYRFLNRQKKGLKRRRLPDIIYVRLSS